MRFYFFWRSIGCLVGGWFRGFRLQLQRQTKGSKEIGNNFLFWNFPRAFFFCDEKINRQSERKTSFIALQVVFLLSICFIYRLKSFSRFNDNKMNLTFLSSQLGLCRVLNRENGKKFKKKTRLLFIKFNFKAFWTDELWKFQLIFVQLVISWNSISFSWISINFL